MNIGIIGMGWFGKPFAEFCLSKGHKVIGTKRNSNATQNLQEGFEILTFEYEDCNPSIHLNKVLGFSEALIFDIPPSAVDSDIFKKNLKSIAKKIASSKIRKAIFISSTSVFSNKQGTVGEQSIPLPESRNGKLLLELEQIWQSVIGQDGMIVRPGGLIGKDRHPAKYLSGRDGLKGKDIPVNLVHLDDLIKMVYAIVTSETNQKIFHAVAAEHPNKMLFYQTMAKRMKLHIPKFEMNDKSIGKTVEAESSKQSLKISFDYENPFEM